MSSVSLAVSSSHEEWLDPAVPLRLESRERGHLDTLRFVPFTLPACGAGEVLIEVKAAGMNFRDVLKALALYPGEAPDARIFGDEVAGVVKAVGCRSRACRAGRPGIRPRRVWPRFAYAGAGRRCPPHSRRLVIRAGRHASCRLS